MAALILGLVIVLGLHLFKAVAPTGREALLSRLGEGPYKGVYSLVSLLGLALIVWGFGRAWQDPVFVYAPPAWGRHVAMAFMLPALILVFASVFPARWIGGQVKHRLLTATILWASAHLLANGDLAGLVLFAAFLAWAVIDLILQPAIPGPTAADGHFGTWDIAAILAGVALYAVLIAGLHFWLFGVSPIN
jgi:uncharacterized membrane protein